MPTKVVTSRSGCAPIEAAIGYRRSVSSRKVISVVPPWPRVMAVKAFSPSLPGGSLIEPARIWIRNATRGEEGLGRRLVRTGAPADGFGVDVIGLFSFAPATVAGPVRIDPSSAATAQRGIVPADPKTRSGGVTAPPRRRPRRRPGPIPPSPPPPRG